MKLYYAPGACSLSPHIVLREAGLEFDLEQVDLRSKQTKSGADFRAVNPKGSVPTLQLDNGEVLTEGAAMVQYLADQKPAAKLAPPAASWERVRLQEWLNYIASELHKGYSPLFNPKASDDWKQIVKANLAQRLDYVSKRLDGRTFLMGDGFTVADAYLFTILSWSKNTGVDLAPFPALTAYMDRVRSRPAVQAALKAEGLLN